MTDTAGPRYVRSDGVVTRFVGGETVMVPIRSNAASLDSVFTLSEVASFVWELLASPRTSEEIAEQLCETFDVSAEVARADTGDFLGSLLEAGLVTRQEG